MVFASAYCTHIASILSDAPVFRDVVSVLIKLYFVGG